MPKKRRSNGLKRGPLTIKDKAYLEKNRHKGVTHLAKMLKRSESLIDAYLNPPEIIPEPPPPPKEDTFLMSNFGVHKKGTGVVVMTENAASLSDSTRKRRSNIPPEFIMNKDRR